MSTTTDQITHRVPGLSCGHCRAAVTAEIEKLTGVQTVDVDLERKTVTVTGAGLDDGALRAAINEAGYDVA